MDVHEHVEQLRLDGERLAEVASTTDPAAPVPTCPDWQLARSGPTPGGRPSMGDRVRRWAPASSRRTAIWSGFVGGWPADADLVGVVPRRSSSPGGGARVGSRGSGDVDVPRRADAACVLGATTGSRDGDPSGGRRERGRRRDRVPVRLRGGRDPPAAAPVRRLAGSTARRGGVAIVARACHGCRSQLAGDVRPLRGSWPRSIRSTATRISVVTGDAPSLYVMLWNRAGHGRIGSGG